MVFPHKVEFDLGGWVDVTTRVRETPGISISRGRADEASQVERTQATFTINNTDGHFSERNPESPYYGLLSLNTPCRISVPRTSTVLEIAADTSGDETTWASCPDAAALDITGDIDVRVDAHQYDWSGSAILAGKSTGSPNISWIFTVVAGCLQLKWSPDGATTLSATSIRLPVTTGRLAVRATLDVNNGAGGHTVTFYTSDTLAGSWTQLGSTAVGTGTTSILAGSISVKVGGALTAGREVFYGWFYKFELRSGIGGTVVANPDFTLQAAGATSFADTASSPNTWTFSGNAQLTDRIWRFHGEVSSWPGTWDITGQNVTVAVTAAGPIRRLTQGASPLQSALARYHSRPQDLAIQNYNVPVAYWPCEDQVGSTVLASALPGGTPLQFSVATPTLAADTGFAYESAIPKLNGSRWTGNIPAYVNDTPLGYSGFEFLFLTPADVVDIEVFRIYTTSSAVARWSIIYNDVSTGRLELHGFDSSGASVVATGGIGFVDDVRVRVLVELLDTGSSTDYAYSVYQVDTGALLAQMTGSFAGDPGNFTHVVVNPDAALSVDAVVGHIVVRKGQLVSPEGIYDAMLGHPGEEAETRFERLCIEESLTTRYLGDRTSTAVMGPQRPVALMELLRECADAEQGMLFEPLDALGLGMRTRHSLQNQTPALVVDHAAGELAEPPIPTSDDQDVHNDVTVTRTGGSSARAELAIGRMSTAAYPNGIGHYPEALTLNVYDDTQVADLAAYRLALGSADEERHPRISISRANGAVAANAALNAELLGLQTGHVMAIDNMPAPYVAPGQTRQLIQGWTERLTSFEHRFDFNCSPGSPWYFGVIEDESYGQIDTDNSVLAAAVDSDDTSLLVTSVEGQYWTEDSANMPFDVLVSGEAITVTGIASGITDTFTRSVSSGWGSATSGQAWTRSGGAAADFSVNGSAGAISVTAVSSERWVTLAQTASAWDVEMRSRTLVLAATQPINTYIGAMLTGTSQGYIARMAFYNGATVRLSIERMPFAMLAAEIIVPGLTHAANSWFRLRFRVQDGLLQAKAWADGSAEPAGWHLSAYDTTYTSGGMGVRTVLTSGNTNTLPVAVQYDDVATHNPQLFTVTRSANDVTKSQAAGADLRLRYPTILSL